MENKSQSTIPNSLPPNSTGSGNKPLDPGGNNAAKHWISKHLSFCFNFCVIKLFYFLLLHISMYMSCIFKKLSSWWILGRKCRLFCSQPSDALNQIHLNSFPHASTNKLPVFFFFFWLTWFSFLLFILNRISQYAVSSSQSRAITHYPIAC